MNQTILKKCGIICEYNPLHNGHIRQIQAAKEQTGCDTLVCIMSGNFVQRGDGAVLDKYTRAVHAIKAGADVVVELPTVFAINSAQDFAFGAIKTLSALGCEYLHFGSECGDVAQLEKVAEFLLNPPSAFTKKLQENLDKGLSYPQAIAKASARYFDNEILNNPNNTLAIEYIKEIKNQHSSIKPVTLKRNSDYNSDDLMSEFCSASAIRTACGKQDFKKIKNHVPAYVFEDLTKNQYYSQQNFEIFAHGFLITSNTDYLKNIYGAEEGLHNKLFKNATLPCYDDLLFGTKSKRYTLLKIKRLILNSVLGITKANMKKAKKAKPYFKVLAINSDRLDILSDFSRCNVSDVKKLNDAQKEMYEIDKKASNLYYALCQKQGNLDVSLPMQKVDVKNKKD
ncbi:MAG: nucleotidyltransferase family protein [Clostridia bacterium]|nr:nucleotidyltransferase family protein [Clostridia bacterium]